jgi:hypothetical protein
MTLPHTTQMWLTEVLQTTTPLGKCPLSGPVQGNGSQESVVRAYPQNGLACASHAPSIVAGRLGAFAWSAVPNRRASAGTPVT